MKFSDLARPPITQEEAEKATHSICVNHDGVVRQTGDKEGRVFFCPVGRMLWRYTAKPQSGLYGPLPYPDSGAF